MPTQCRFPSSKFGNSQGRPRQAARPAQADFTETAAPNDVSFGTRLEPFFGGQAMKSSSSAHGRITRILGILAVASLLTDLLPSVTASAQSTPPPSKEPAAAAAEAQRRADWRATMARTPQPKSGCFKAEYPKTEWQEVPCTTAPNKPYPPARGLRPQTVGNGTDYAARVASSLISSSTGSFDNVTNGISESGYVGGAPPAVADTFSLQLNTSFFPTSVCSTSPNPNCRGWQQFIYSSSYKAVFMQYWLITYNAACSTAAGGGWNTYTAGGNTYCYKNSVAASVPIAQTAADLHLMSLTGTAGATDLVQLSTTNNSISNIYTASGNGNVLNLASGWTDAEYNIVGDCCGSSANFSAGSTIVVRTTVHNGTTNAPLCELEGFTGETNNLTLVGTPAVPPGPSPAIVFTQSNVAGSPASCAAATGIGDTHLTTFNGLLYDFQAAGDFVLAEADPAFVVQTRQVSGKPNWPNATVNKAVATRMGNTRVAICLPSRLIIDGKTADLGDGKSISRLDGVNITRKGNVYVVVDQTGNSMRAELNPTWINVAVGLGHWPANVRGLLANANNNINQIAMRDGTVLTEPVSFTDLYGRFGDSWRVPSKESLLSVCADKPGQQIESRNPEKPFYANDLNPNDYKRARAICTEAGVKEPALLDACTLDTVVLGNKTAARVFVRADPPRAVLQLGLRR